MIPFLISFVLPMVGLAGIGWVLYTRMREPRVAKPYAPKATLPDPTEAIGTNRVEYGRWFTIERCPGCKTTLAHEDQFYTNGVCPRDRWFIQTEKMALRKVTTYDANGRKLKEATEIKRITLTYNPINPPTEVL